MSYVSMKEELLKIAVDPAAVGAFGLGNAMRGQEIPAGLHSPRRPKLPGRGSLLGAGLAMAAPLALTGAAILAHPKSRAEIQDPRLYSNVRGGFSGESAEERVRAHKDIERGNKGKGILRAMKAGFSRSGAKKKDAKAS